ncbi:hypothetical protein DFP90_10362 [Aestuariispira insulae]|uniref:Uncharacterized protein n=1 Tax=Aestuariispira insulae TaxID=1461337 RepID=A0A3D9HP38_9PROT|nr:hypothetical protein DFP90_10362 [Aestuariispira insulae]
MPSAVWELRPSTRFPRATGRCRSARYCLSFSNLWAFVYFFEAPLGKLSHITAQDCIGLRTIAAAKQPGMHQ